MTTKLQIDLYDLASRFVGLREAAGSANNPAILGMLHLDAQWPTGDDVPWCSAFCNYVAWLLDVPRSKSLRARSWLSVGIPIDLDDAQRGQDVVIFSRGPNPEAGHVAFFDAREGHLVRVLGGNQADMVSVATYPVARVVGVRRLYGDA